MSVHIYRSAYASTEYLRDSFGRVHVEILNVLIQLLIVSPVGVLNVVAIHEPLYK